MCEHIPCIDECNTNIKCFLCNNNIENCVQCEKWINKKSIVRHLVKFCENSKYRELMKTYNIKSMREMDEINVCVSNLIHLKENNNYSQQLLH